MTRIERHNDRRKKNGKKTVILILLVALLIILAFIGGVLVGEQMTQNENAEVTAAQALANVEDSKIEKEELDNEEEADLVMTSDIVVGKPQDYSIYQAIAILEDRNLTDNRYQQILDDTSIYPEKLLINLANNPEMLQFVLDYSTKQYETQEVILNEREKTSECPLFLQWDSRWGYLAYGDNNIAISGCGPTALSMVVIGLTGDETKTPDAIAEYATNYGYYLKGTGTKWKLMKEGAAHFGLDSEEIKVNEYQMKNALDNGKYLICSVRKGDFTVGGHFIVICGYDEDGFIINDPMCIYRSNQRWDYATIHNQIKSIWEIGVSI